MYLKITIILTITLNFQNVQSAQNTTFIHQVMVVAADGGVDNYCGGGLVTLTWTLTSLKCIEDLAQNFHILEAVAGFNDKNVANKQTRSIIKYISHVDSDNRNDIGLVEVDKPFLPTAELNPARLPQQGEAICDTATILSVFPEKATIESTEGLKHFGNYYFSKILKTIRKLKMKVNGTVKEGILEVVMRTGIHFAMDVDVTAVVLGSEKKMTNAKSKWNQRVKRKRRKGPRNEQSEEHAIFISSVERAGPPAGCKGSKGWPLYCGDVIFGIETDCKLSEARSNEEMGTYADVGSNEKFITKAFAMKLQIDKLKSSLQWTMSGDNFLHGNNVWKKVLVMMVVVRFLFFYFF